MGKSGYCENHFGLRDYFQIQKMLFRDDVAIVG
jgi:hypothetical protein